MKIYPVRDFKPLKPVRPNGNKDKRLYVSNCTKEVSLKTPVDKEEEFKLLNYSSMGAITPFCGKKKVTADNVKQRAREICASCHYGKADILNVLDKLKIKKGDGKLFLEGYYTEKDDGKIMTGVCEELAHKAGTLLGEEFKDDYAPIILSFSGTKYDFSEHVCVVMIKRNEKNDAQIEGIRNLNYGENLCDIEDYDGQTLFDGAIFVDPSFGIVCDIEKLPSSYKTIVGFNTLEKNNPYNGPKEIDPESNNYLGYVKDICPELLAIDFPPKGMVSFVVPKEKPGKLFKKRLIFRIVLPENGRYITGNVEDLKKALPKSKFTAFMLKLEDELKKPEDLR